MDDSVIERMADAVMRVQESEGGVLPTLRRQLDEAAQGIENMLNAIQYGIFTPSTQKRLSELEALLSFRSLCADPQAAAIIVYKYIHNLYII